MIRRICGTIDSIVMALLGLFLAGVVVTCLLAVWMRYISNLPISWSEQVARIGLVWIILLGTAVAYRRKRHVAVELFYTMLPARYRPSLSKVVELMNLALFVIFTWHGAKLTLDNLGQTYGALGISVASYYAAMPIAGALMLLFWLERVVTADWEQPLISETPI
ncbi:TRAP transporter small permease [Shinella sp. S4-D37]|uniref:TRAP transporter small permease n=1 Tax=Shinella sp. S4-D37 TaxID=3161999 RepID=UPI0034662DA9